MVEVDNCGRGVHKEKPWHLVQLLDALAESFKLSEVDSDESQIGPEELLDIAVLEGFLTLGHPLLRL